MSTEMQTKVQASPAQSFTPVQTGLLQRKSALCNTPGLVEDSEQDKEKLTLQRSSVDQVGTTTLLRFGHNFSKVSVYSTGRGMIQTKLKINEPRDIYEQEADRVAEQVMRMKEPRVQRQQEEEILQPKELPGRSNEVTPALSSSIYSLRGGGQPLSENDRAFFEPRLNHDFSQVRTHTDTRASESALAMNAKAFTIGQDVAFGAGQFTSETHEGRRLIAHELTHVIQQGLVGSPGALSIQRQINPSPPPQPTSGLSEIMLKQIARQLRDAMVGWGTDEEAIYSTFSGRTQEQVDAIARVYQQEYDRSLINDLMEELNESEMKHLAIFSPTTMERYGTTRADQSKTRAKMLAIQVHKAMKGWGTDEDEVYRKLLYPPETVRTMINYYNDNLNDLTGKGFVEDLKDEFSGSELKKAMELLANAKIAENIVEKTTKIESMVTGDPNKVWVGLIVRGMWSREHEPGVLDQHADVVIPDASGSMQTRGFFGDGPGSSASIGMGLSGISADMNWFLSNRTAYVDLGLAKLTDMKSSLILLKVTKNQVKQLNEYWDDLKNDPGTFNILGRNCSTAAAAGFKKAHITKEISGLDTPDNLFQQLRAEYKEAFMISGYYGYTRTGRKWKMVGGRPTLDNPGAGPWDGPYVVERRLS